MAPNFSSPGVGVFIEKPRYRRKERVNPEGNERVAQVSHNWLDASGYFLPNLLRKKILFSSRCLHIYISPLSRFIRDISLQIVREWIFEKKKKKFHPLGMSKGFESRAENSIKDTRPPVKDSVLELRTRMARMMSIVNITPRDRRLVAALAIRFFSFSFFFLFAINDE